MLAASAAFLALLGVGFVLMPGDDEDDTMNTASEDTEENLEDMPEDDLEIVPLDEFIDGAPSTADLEDPDEPQVEPSMEEDANAGTGGDDAAEFDGPVAEDASDDDDMSEEDEPSDDLASDDEATDAPSNVVAGGPGDTLVGGPALDSFDVTVGEQGDPETVIQNLFDVAEDDDSGLPATSTEIETIWLRDEDGTLISRDDLFAADMHLDEDEARGGVTLSLNGHATLFVEDVTLDDFTENSLILGNFQMARSA
ncbi:MAG: hypothetical protein AB8B60_06190 [Sulfitobacter sp.]